MDMTPGTIDLHIHTTCSDGLDTPEEIVETSVQAGYEIISITDHDTVDGIERALCSAEGYDIECIPGIELSSIEGLFDVHILGYYFNFRDQNLRRRIETFKEKRRERAEEIVRILNRLGLDLQIDTVLRIAHGAPVGRPHIAEALVSEELVHTYSEAFMRYIGDAGPAYVPKDTVSPQEAVELIRSAGGAPVLAHPSLTNRDELIPELKECGLMGVEAIHPLHSREKQLYYEKLAERYELVVTGGSDWHGMNRSKNFRSLARHTDRLRQSAAIMKMKTGKQNERYESKH